MSYRDSLPVPKAQLAGLAFSLGVLAFASPARAATSGANGTHDPSRMIASDGKFYVYSTGGGIKSSTDGLVWADEKASLFPLGIPQSGTSVVSNNEGVWAPDVIYLNNQYYIYYAIANAQNACAVGLETTPTLDPTSPNYKLTDRGVVVSNGNTTYCAIDPCPVLDASGNLWLSFGSGYSKPSTDNTIYVMRLDNTTGLASSATAAPGTPLEPGHIEASYIYYHTGYYYLFWNSGGCCDGASSTYEIHMARSQAITGPYTGSQIFIQSAGSVHGPGQIGIFDQCGADRFTYHYYPDSGGSVLGENELSWGSDGWPVAGASSTTPLTACAPTGVVAADAGSPDAAAGDAGSPDGSAESVPPDDGGAGDDATTGTPESGEADSGGGGDDAGITTGPADAGGTGSRQEDGGATTPPGGGGTGTGGGSSGGCNVSGPQGRDSFAGLGLLVGLSLWVARRKRQHQAAPRG
jgi:arabinan endo-1,5-alpha-L-arabinosidase